MDFLLKNILLRLYLGTFPENDDVDETQAVTLTLVTSKSRVAPLKGLSLPRLKLLRALLAARLTNEVKKVLCQKGTFSMHFYANPQIALYWIKDFAHRWNLN